MVGALWTGISGLAGSQTALDNESNNIANVNTIGYKASRISFADQMYQDKIGKGVTSFDIEKMYTQGNLKNTGVSHDMALNGDGFFTVSNGFETYYTRAGNFRMGESGKLEDVGQNAVQGWAMSPISPDDDVISTDPNATYFTNAFSKVLGTKIIRDSTTIETIAAKATDYTKTAVSDVATVFEGFGAKTASSKKSDVDALITEYNSLLTTHAKANPKPTSADSSVQKDYLNFNLNTVNLEEGDELYVYIDNKRYKQKFDTDEATTLKKFADKIANIKGFDAHVTNAVVDNATGTVKEGTYEYDNISGKNPKGGIYIESLIPGTQYRISEFGSVDTSNDNQTTKGEVKNIQAAVQGTGIGAITSIEMAMKKAIAGKQQDVYTADELMLSSNFADNKFSYKINIYDNVSKKNINIFAKNDPMKNPAGTDGVNSIDDIVSEINNVANVDGIAAKDELAYYVKAFNINGNLVVQTLDNNADVEFTGELKGPIPEQQMITLTGDVMADGSDTVAGEVQALSISGFTGTGTATDKVSFLGTEITYDNSTGVTAATASLTTAINTAATNNAIKDAWNLENPDRKILTITATDSDPEVDLVVEYQQTAGDVVTLETANNNGLTFGPVTTTTAGDSTATIDFLESTITTTKGATLSSVIDKIIGDKAAIIDAWNFKGGSGTDSTDDADDDNELREIQDIVRVSADEIKIIYKNTEGDVPNIGAASDNGLNFSETSELIKGSFNGLITKNFDVSGREGAGAEFLKITTTINQTSTQDAIQLRLDSLGLTDSAFGDFAVDKTGLVTMQQDGVNFAVGQVSVAKFTDNRGLEAVGGNLLKATTRSGTALYNIDNDKTAEIRGGQLELSTADLSESLVNLMVFQRAFEANAKSITTADQILTTLIQLKR